MSRLEIGLQKKEMCQVIRCRRHPIWIISCNRSTVRGEKEPFQKYILNIFNKYFLFVKYFNIFAAIFFIFLGLLMIKCF
jgi:hypothetical protein